MPFQRATEVFGVDVLRPLAHSRQVWSNWRGEGLPWEVAGPLLLTRMERDSQSNKASVVKTPALREAKMPAPLDQAREDLTRIYFHYHPDSEEWQAVVRLIRLVAPREAASTEVEKPSPKMVPRRRN